ncbi:MAG: hypothetical protein M1482_08880 [Chloroflexi bacterium]|nr:hypothetical protein [Chloroflexota bacterium]
MREAPIMQVILSRQNEGTTEAVGEDGVSRLYAFTRLRDVPRNDIYVSVGIPTAVAFAEADQALETNLLALGLVAVLALGAAWFRGVGGGGASAGRAVAPRHQRSGR